MKYTLLLLFLVILFPSCEELCESEKSGELDLDLSSEKYVPPTEDGNVLFADSDGNLMTVARDVQQLYTNRNCVEYACEIFSDPYAPLECKYYQTESIRHLYTFPDDTIVVDLSLSVMNYEEESTLFYDYLRIGMSGIGQLAYGEFVTAVRFTDPVFDPAQVNLLAEMEAVGEKELNGTTYTDILQTSGGQATLWIGAGEGLIGFELEGVTWNLVE